MIKTLKKLTYRIFQLTLILSFVNFTSFAVEANQTYHGSVSFIAPGTPVQAQLTQTISSEFTNIGDKLMLNLSEPVYSNSGLAFPAGSVAETVVSSVNKAGRGGKPGSISLQIQSIITPNGQRIPVKASIDQEVFKLQASGGRVSHMVKGTAAGSAAGALSGLIGGAISGGRVGKGAALGTAVGGGIGLVGSAFKRGKEFILQAGQPIPFRITQAVTLGKTQNNMNLPNRSQAFGGYQNNYSKQNQSNFIGSQRSYSESNYTEQTMPTSNSHSQAPASSNQNPYY